MRHGALHNSALVIAACGGLVVALAASVGSLRIVLVQPATLITAATAAILFLRILLDPKCRQGIDAANAEMRGGRSWPSGARVKLMDPDWGLLGSRYGDRLLQFVRVALLIEFLMVLVLAGRTRTDLVLLAATSFAIPMLLSLIHVAAGSQSVADA